MRSTVFSLRSGKMVKIRSLFIAFVFLATANYFFAQVSPLSTLMSLGFVLSLFFLSGWGTILSTRFRLGMSSRWASVALGTVAFLSIFLVLSRIFLEPLSSFINIKRVALCLYIAPTLYLVIRRSTRKPFVQLWSAFDLVDTFTLLLITQIFNSYTHTLGGVGHDSTQHIYWVNSIGDAGFSPLNVRGVKLIELYPKSFHSLAAVWGFFVDRDYTAPLVRAMSPLQNLLAFVLLFEQFAKLKKGILGLLVVFLFFCIFSHPELEKLSDGAPRISGLLIFIFSVLSLHRFLIVRKPSLLIISSFAIVLLLSMSPAYAFSFFSIPTFLWFLNRIENRDLFKTKDSFAVGIPFRYVLGACTVLVVILFQDPYYFGYLTRFVSTRLSGPLTAFNFESSWVFNKMSAAADPVASFALQFSWENFFSWFKNSLGTSPAFYKLFFPNLFGSSTATGVLVTLFFLFIFLLRTPKNFFVLVLTLWMSTLAVVWIGSTLPEEVQVAAILRVYSIGSLAFVYSSGFLALFNLYSLTVLAEKFSFPKLRNFSDKRLPAATGLALAVLMTYGSHFTHLTSRNGAWGKVTLEDLRHLDSVEEFLKDSSAILPCTLPADSAKEKWVLSIPSSVLISLGRSPNYYCNFYLGRSATLSYAMTNNELCGRSDHTYAALKKLKIEYAVFWSPKSDEPKKASEISVCRNEKTLRDWGFEEKPSQTYGKILVFGLDERFN
jgi:hypothetical protein